jgi:hypothetical protein
VFNLTSHLYVWSTRLYCIYCEHLGVQREGHNRIRAVCAVILDGKSLQMCGGLRCIHAYMLTGRTDINLQFVYGVHVHKYVYMNIHVNLTKLTCLFLSASYQATCVCVCVFAALSCVFFVQYTATVPIEVLLPCLEFPGTRTELPYYTRRHASSWPKSYHFYMV